MASANGTAQAGRQVLIALGADINIRDAHGYSAMHHAASSRDSIFVQQLLLQCGGSCSDVSREAHKQQVGFTGCCRSKTTSGRRYT